MANYIKRDAEADEHRKDTLPPPPSGDAYSAETRVQQASPKLLEALKAARVRAEGERLPDQSAVVPVQLPKLDGDEREEGDEKKGVAVEIVVEHETATRLREPASIGEAPELASVPVVVTPPSPMPAPAHALAPLANENEEAPRKTPTWMWIAFAFLLVIIAVDCILAAHS